MKVETPLMADDFMHAVQYDAYGGGAAALKVFNFHFHIFHFAISLYPSNPVDNLLNRD